MFDGSSLVAVVQSRSGVNTTLQCSNSTNEITNEQSIFASLDVTLTPLTHGAEVIHTICLEAGVVYEADFTFFNFGPSTDMRRLLLDSVRMIT